MPKLFAWRMAFLVSVFCALAVTKSPGQTFSTLITLDGTNGGTPLEAQLVQATDGKLYGTTEFAGTCGGSEYGGTVFKMTASGAMTVLYNFCGGAAGYNPNGGLVQASNGLFYGTNTSGGAYGGVTGTIFKITSQGALTTLVSFDGADGQDPIASLVQGTDGNLYGTTEGGGAYGGGPYSNGTVFKMTLAGSLSTLYSFDGSDGSQIGTIVQGTDGNFYGTATSGGTYGSGRVFRITPTGAPDLTPIYDFCSQPGCVDGANPYGLVLGSDGNFYGAAEAGGNANAGTIFKITPSGELTTIYSFCSASGCSDGESPDAPIQGSDGNFYGATSAGGAYGYGTVFELTPGGALTTLYSFCAQAGCPDGAYPVDGLVQDTNGIFYGTAVTGGSVSYTCAPGFFGVPGCGTIFSLSTGLVPFVQPRLTMGKVGSKITILGTNLTGSKAVSFNGTSASFTASANEITTTVPSGATTGEVTVTTAKGATLDSNGPFWVTPQFKSFSPTSGPVGTPVTITGVSLTQTLSVEFNGVAASSVTVNSDTQVTAIVPTGATTGNITVTTAGGTVTSAASFRVTK